MQRGTAPARLSHATRDTCAVLGVAPEECVKTRDIPFLFQSNSAVSELIGAEHSQEGSAGAVAEHGSCHYARFGSQMSPNWPHFTFLPQDPHLVHATGSFGPTRHF